MIIIMNTKVNKKWNEDDYQKTEKQNKKSQRKIKFNKGVGRIKSVGKIFVKSFGMQAVEPSTLVLAGLIGLGQGFKYNGNLKRGLVAGAVTMSVMGTIYGITNVAKYLKDTKHTTKT